MKLKLSIIAILGGLMLVAALLVGCFELFGTEALARHSVWYLNKFFGPGHAPEYTYDMLYQYASDITHHRNHQAFFYQSIICVMLTALGTLFLLWGRDIVRLTGRDNGSDPEASERIAK
jgi:hypothetical protein